MRAAIGARPKPGIAPGRQYARGGVVPLSSVGRAARGRRSSVAVQAVAAPPSSAGASSPSATPSKPESVPLTPQQLQLLQQHQGATLVKIATHYHVNFGDCLRVIGSAPEFGAWVAAEAPLMTWGEGDVWSLVLPLAPGDYEFKVVVQQANGNLIWEAGDDNRLVSVPEDAPPNSMLVSVCAFNIIDGAASPPRLLPVTADVVSLLEARLAEVAAAADAAAAAAAEAAAAEMERNRTAQAANSVAKALATMDAEAELTRPKTIESDSDSDDDSTSVPSRTRAPVIAAAATELPLQYQQQEEEEQQQEEQEQQEVSNLAASTAAAAAPAAPAIDVRSREYQNEADCYSAEAEAALAAAASVRAKLAKDKPVAVGFVPAQRAPANPPSSVVAAFMKSVGGKVEEPAAEAPAAAQPTETAAAAASAAATAAPEAPAAAPVSKPDAEPATQAPAVPADSTPAPLPKGWGPTAGASLFPARAAAADASSSSGSVSSAAVGAPGFSSSMAAASGSTPPNSPSKPQRPPSPGRGASHVVSAAAAAAVAAEWIAGVRSNDVVSAAREAEKAASELSARLQQAQQKKSEAAAEADRLNETLKHSSLVKGVAAVPSGSSDAAPSGVAAPAGWPTAATDAPAAAPSTAGTNGWMGAVRSKVGSMTDAAMAAVSDSTSPLSPPPITPIAGGAPAFAAASGALSAATASAAAGLGPSPPPVIHTPGGGSATTQRSAVSTQAAASGALAAAGAASFSAAGAEAGTLEGGSAGGAAGVPDGMQLLASVVGSAAVGTVLWSEFVLKETGCGLPPGPYGLLGAAEGLSYLAVLGFAGAGVGARVKSSGKQGLPGALAVPETLAYGALSAGLIVLASQLHTYGYIPSMLPGDQCFGDAAVALPDQLNQLHLQEQLIVLQRQVDSFSDYVSSQAAVVDAAVQLGLLELQDRLLTATDSVSAFVDTQLQQLDVSGKLDHVLDILRAQEQQLKVELPQQLAELQQLAATSVAVVQETALHASSTAHLPELLASLDHVMATLHGVLESRISQLDVVLTSLQSSIGAAAGQLAGAVKVAQQSGSTEAAAQLQGLQALLADAMTDVQAQVWAGYQQLALADKLSDMLLAVRTSAHAVATSTASEVDKLRLQEQLQQLEGLAESSAAALSANVMDSIHHMKLDERLHDIGAQASAAAASLQAGLDQLYARQLPVVEAQMASLQAGLAQMAGHAQQHSQVAQQVAAKGSGVVVSSEGDELQAMLRDLQASMDTTMKLVGEVASSSSAPAAGADAVQSAGVADKAGEAASAGLAAVGEQLGAATDAVSTMLAGSLPDAAAVVSSSSTPDVAVPAVAALRDSAPVVASQAAAVTAATSSSPVPGFVVDTAAATTGAAASAAAPASPVSVASLVPDTLAAAFGEAVESGMDFSQLVAYALPDATPVLDSLPDEHSFHVSGGLNLSDASDTIRGIWWNRPQ